MLNELETDTPNLKRYLLNDLSLAETEAIDLHVISDAAFEEKLLWAESELMEDYLEETLTAKDLKLFKENFLVSAERLTQLNQISLMRNYAKNAQPEQSATIILDAPTGNFVEKLNRFFSLNWRPTIAVFALIFVGLFAVIYLTGTHQTVSEKEFAALNQKDLSDLEQLKSFTNVGLVSNVFRDSGESRRLTENSLTEKVLFRLALPVPSNVPEKFRAELVKDGKVVFTLANLTIYKNPNGQELRLFLPATELKKGDYQVKLTKEKAPEAIYVYNFAVE